MGPKPLIFYENGNPDPPGGPPGPPGTPGGLRQKLEIVLSTARTRIKYRCKTPATEITKPCEFIGFGAMEATKPYEFIGFGATEITNTMNV